MPQPTGWREALGIKTDALPSAFAVKHWNILPHFILFLDCVHQLIKMNPADFEYNVRYITYLASHIYSNKFFEFVQGNDPSHASVSQFKLLSVFDSLPDLGNYTNRVFRSNQGKQLLYRFQEARKIPLHYVPKQMNFWHEYFCRFNQYSSYKEWPLSKESRIVEKRAQNEKMIEEIIANLKEVNSLRRAKSDLVFTAQFLIEHRKLVTLLKTISGLSEEEIDERTDGKGLAMELVAQSQFRK